MIQSPIEALRARRWETGAVMCLMALAFFLPGVLLIATERVHHHAEAWLLAYQPVVYVQEGASPEQLDALEGELGRWPGVHSVSRRSRKDSLKFLSEELGAERLAHLGISASMLPTSLELAPSVPLQGHIELASKVAALEVRPEVAAVDVPDKDALKLMSFARTMTLCALLMMAMMCACAMLLARAHLRRIQHEERDMLELLEVFGASQRSLTRPSMARALLMSVWAGGGATVLLFLAQLNLDRWVSGIFGVDAMAPMTWMVVFLPLLGSPFVGFVLGKSTTGFGGFSQVKTSLEGVRSMIRYSGSPQFS